MCYGFIKPPRDAPQGQCGIGARCADFVGRHAEDALTVLQAVKLGQQAPAEARRRLPERSAEGALRKTVIFVRHGQAVHNIVEERAKEQAARQAKACGHAKDSEEFQAAVKLARLAALSDEALRDAALSEVGEAQIEATRHKLERMAVASQPLPRPTAVLVSPLLRTLQTAAILFPEHPNVHVCKVLCERRTGLPCDLCSDQNRIALRFPNIDFDQDLLPQCASIVSEKSEEDAVDLRRRTASLAALLRHLEDETVAVVSHKGFLRELQRGPLHHGDATEFGQAEARVFDVTLWPDGSMDAHEFEDAEAA